MKLGNVSKITRLCRSTIERISLLGCHLIAVVIICIACYRGAVGSRDLLGWNLSNSNTVDGGINVISVDPIITMHPIVVSYQIAITYECPTTKTTLVVLTC